MQGGQQSGRGCFASPPPHRPPDSRRGAGPEFTWVFHVDAVEEPTGGPNGSNCIIPGSDVVDWLAVSV